MLELSYTHILVNDNCNTFIENENVQYPTPKYIIQLQGIYNQIMFS